MGVALIAAGVGLLLGLVAGGHPRHCLAHRWSLWPMIVIGLGLQILAEVADLSSTLALLAVLGSYASLIVFGLANFSTVGMTVVVVGFFANMVPIAVNSGMPVDREAIVIAGIAQPSEMDMVDLGSKRHVSSASDHLQWLGDIIPVETLGIVISFGDLIIAAGVGDVMFRLLVPLGVKRRRDQQALDDRWQVIDLSGEVREPIHLTSSSSMIDLTGTAGHRIEEPLSDKSIEAAH